MKNNYTADHIKVLDDLSHIRLRRQMYIGDNGAKALLNEIVDNAIDEVKQAASRITVHAKDGAIAKIIEDLEKEL